MEPLRKVKINNLFARSVIENHVSGKVYADQIEHPTTFYVVHPYGISLLFGESNNLDFNHSFREYALNANKTRDKYEWMQGFPKDWNVFLCDLFAGNLINHSDAIATNDPEKIEINTRVNFKFNVNTYLNLKKKNIPANSRIVRTNKEIFNHKSGSVIPYYFWDKADDFYKNGVGFSLLHENNLASTAFSSFIHENQLEIGIETLETYRGKGFAQLVCSAFIDYCIENKYEPIWSCKLENSASYQLAQLLGFEPILTIPFYRLSK